MRLASFIFEGREALPRDHPTILSIVLVDQLQQRENNAWKTRRPAKISLLGYWILRLERAVQKRVSWGVGVNSCARTHVAGSIVSTDSIKLPLGFHDQTETGSGRFEVRTLKIRGILYCRSRPHAVQFNASCRPACAWQPCWSLCGPQRPFFLFGNCHRRQRDEVEWNSTGGPGRLTLPHDAFCGTVAVRAQLITTEFCDY